MNEPDYSVYDEFQKKCGPHEYWLIDDVPGLMMFICSICGFVRYPEIVTGAESKAYYYFSDEWKAVIHD